MEFRKAYKIEKNWNEFLQKFIICIPHLSDLSAFQKNPTLSQPTPKNPQPNFSEYIKALTMAAQFQETFTRVMSELNNAKAAFDKSNRSRALNLNDLSPKSLPKNFFNGRLKPLTRQSIHMIYDMCVAHSGGLMEVMSLVAGMQHTCSLYTKDQYSLAKVYICDIKQTKTMIVPETPDDYAKLFEFTESLVVGTELLNMAYINVHKSAKAQTHQSSTSTNLTELRNHIRDGRNAPVATFAAVLLWMLDTKQMNKQVITHNSAASCAQLNTETMLMKKLPVVAKAPEPEPEPEPEAAAEPEPLAPLEPEEEVDDWESLADF